MRRLLVALLLLSGLAPVVWGGRGLFLARSLRCGDYAALERWGGDPYFLRAVERLPPCSSSHQSNAGKLLDWAARRYAVRFPKEQITDLTRLPSNELALLLWSNYDEGRIVVIDPFRCDVMTADSGPIDEGAWRMDWQGNFVIVHGYAKMDVTLVLRREGAGFRLLPSVTGHDGDPFFFAWSWTRFRELDEHGFPIVECDSGEGAECQGCGSLVDYYTHHWKMIDGAYRPWGEWQGVCENGCDLPWPN